MEMVAAAKMRKAQERMRHARPYAEKIGRVASHFSQAHPEYRHPFVVSRETTRRVGLILVTTDKGLCGGLNTNALRMAVTKLKGWDEQKIEVDICAIGNKGLGFMQRLGGNIASQVAGMGDTPHMERLIGPVQVMLDAFKEGRIDALHLIYSRFISTMKQESAFKQLLPLSAEEAVEKAEHHWDYIYEPEARSVVDGLMVRYIEALIYPGRGGEHGMRAVRPDGGHEVRFRQCQERDRGTQAGLQQDPPGRDHPGNQRNRRGGGGSMTPTTQRLRLT
jgi:F-type H+-transporting ATPase subunit gamma